MAILLKEDDGSCYAVNIPEVRLEDKEIIIKNWSENSVFIEKIRKCGYFTDTGKRIPTGYVEAEIWKLNSDVKIENGFLVK